MSISAPPNLLNPTLLDLAKISDPDGKVTQNLIEILNQQNEILEDITWQEGNLLDGHRSTIRTGIPVPTWRAMYQGVQPTKGTTAQVTDRTGMLEAYAEVDKALADLNGNSAAWRMKEDNAHIEGMNQEVTSKLFNGNEALVPNAFTGLSVRFNSSTASNGQNVIKAGGSGSDNASIYLVVWSPTTVYGVVPKNSKAGLQMEDLGRVTIENIDGNGGRMEAYRSHYRWDAGLVVADWRYVVRICNIDKSDLKPDASTGADLIDLMTEALDQVPNLSVGRPAFYMSRSIRSVVRRQAVNKTKSSTLTVENLSGRRVTSFDGVPLRRVDQLGGDETLVS